MATRSFLAVMRRFGHLAILAALVAVVVGGGWSPRPVEAQSAAPTPLLAKDRPVDWWFVFKLNATFPDRGGDARTCPFGGTVQKYKSKVGQQWVFASSEQSALTQGTVCLASSACWCRIPGTSRASTLRRGDFTGLVRELRTALPHHEGDDR